MNEHENSSGVGAFGGRASDAPVGISRERRELTDVTLHWAAVANAVGAYADRLRSQVDAMRTTAEAFDRLAGRPDLKRSELERLIELCIESEAASAETRVAVAALLGA